MDHKKPGACVRELWPLLWVSDIERSLAFYRDLLGFELVAEARNLDQLSWCRVQRGGASLMLQQVEAGQVLPSQPAAGIALYFVCDDAATLHAALTARGLALPPPVAADYGMLQVFVPEPDGYPLCFESPT